MAPYRPGRDVCFSFLLLRWGWPHADHIDISDRKVVLGRTNIHLGTYVAIWKHSRSVYVWTPMPMHLQSLKRVELLCIAWNPCQALYTTAQSYLPGLMETLFYSTKLQLNCNDEQPLFVTDVQLIICMALVSEVVCNTTIRNDCGAYLKITVTELDWIWAIRGSVGNFPLTSLAVTNF